MEAVSSEFDLVLRAFWLTLQLFVLSGLASLALGTALGALRVCPVSVLRRAAAFYVGAVRNTPLLIVFVFVFIAAPTLGWFIGTPFLLKGVFALSLYTAAFVCEALRSGINAVPLGQAEASRAIGMTFTQSMREVVLPQAFRAVVPPLASVLIALAKNTSVAAAFGLLEATARMDYFTNRNADQRMQIFLVFALGYIILVEVVSAGAGTLERRWRVAR
ncbi:MAG: ABC-type amino acid transport system, permease component [uncultured Nocardioidaceae bacterium]|uniref:ABC-type amino acid transport system, permease component n=1 Tax=uncultured Nocardioidaceae bacterium TaxID=253824 RepID=A0A6J4MG88_9ACTN|nr:MAG: ABC-type amino acid transport system, permease component [uncultured Nocardioidaceae bacterium]